MRCLMLKFCPKRLSVNRRPPARVQSLSIRMANRANKGRTITRELLDQNLWSEIEASLQSATCFWPLVASSAHDTNALDSVTSVPTK